MPDATKVSGRVPCGAMKILIPLVAIGTTLGVLRIRHLRQERELEAAVWAEATDTI